MALDYAHKNVRRLRMARQRNAAPETGHARWGGPDGWGSHTTRTNRRSGTKNARGQKARRLAWKGGR